MLHFTLVPALALAAAQPGLPPAPPLPDISPDHALPSCPPPPGPPSAPASPGLAIGGIPFAPADIETAEQTWEPQAGQPVVMLTLTETGRAKFLALQRTDCAGQVLEIRVDGALLSAPILRERIEGARIVIEGGLTPEEAAALAARLGPSASR